MSDWSYFNPVRVIFAAGAVSRLADHVTFRRVVLVTSSGFTRRGVVARVRQSLRERLIHVLDDVQPNPDLRAIDDQVARIRDMRPDCILALGGGSSMDTAKALARLLTQPATKTLVSHFRAGDAFLDRPALPLVTVPTTAGTGSEVTPFATVWDFERNKKYSVAGADLYSDTAVLDPELTLDLPRETTVASGLDAISHALESAWSRGANPVTLGFATASLQLSLQALPVVAEKPEDVTSRGLMLQASLLAGMAISQTRTALAHSISYPLTTRFHLPHGIACSFTLPTLTLFNAHADDGRLLRLVQALGHPDIPALAAHLSSLLARLRVSDLFKRYVPEPEMVHELVGEMLTPGRADNNLRTVSLEDVRRVVSDAIVQVGHGYVA